MRKQTLWVVAMLITCATHLAVYAQQPTVFIQHPTANFVAVEAEQFSSYFDHNPANTDLQSWNTVNDGDASGGKTLVAADGVQGNNGQGIDGLQDAKANFYLQFKSSGTYFLYVRYKNVTGGSSFYISDGFNRPLRSFSPNLPNSTPAGHFRWEQISLQRRGDFPGDFVVTPNDIGKLLTLSFWPREKDFRFDRFVLSTDKNLSASQLDALLNTNNEIAPYPSYLLQSTSFEGLNQELGILSTTNAILMGFSGNIKGEFFPYVGNKVLYMDQQSGGLTPQVTFRPVRLDCYSQSQVCFRWFSPAALSDEFEASDRFRAALIYQDAGGNTISTLPVLDIPGEGVQQIDVLGDSYLEYCYVIHDDNNSLPMPDDGASPAPNKATQVSLQFTLMASEDNEDIVIDEVYFSTTDPNPVTANISKLAIDNATRTLTVDAGGSTGGFLYIYAFSDGSLSLPQQDPEVDMTHTFANPGTYGVSLFVLDVCGNLRAIDYRTVDVLLPVEWLSFSAKASDQDVILHWATSTESNNDYFDIESSRDGKAFSVIGWVKGAGSSQIEQNYSFLDKYPGSGLHYYRLKQVDFDGTLSYSPIKSVLLASDRKVQLYPNPAKGEVQVIKPFEGHLAIQLFDTYGRMVKAQTLSSIDQTLFLTGLAPGLYFVRYRLEDKWETESLRLVVE